MLDGHYSVTEAAAILGVDRKTIYRYRQNGYMKEKHHRYNKRPFVTGREILKIFDACE